MARAKAQEYIKKEFKKSARCEIVKLKIDNRRLEGYLDLTDFVNLKELYCSDNQITGLNVSNCLQLERLECQNNQLTILNLSKLPNIKKISVTNNCLENLYFSLLNHKKITNLDVSNNNFPSQDLSFFSELSNLEVLTIGNYNDERWKENLYNRFHGSLKFLQELKKLDILAIYNTNIDSGLEYLPDSLNTIYCSADRSSINWSVSKIEGELKPYKSEVSGFFAPYNYASWRGHMKKLLVSEELEKLRQKINEQDKYFVNKMALLNEKTAEKMIEENKSLKSENERLREKLEIFIKKEKARISRKEEQLWGLTNDAKRKLDDDDHQMLDNLLITQKELDKNNNNLVLKKTVNGLKEQLLQTKKISKKEVEEICALQTSIIKSERELEILKNEDSRYEEYIEIITDLYL